ncbi:DUF2642 domain-containing protein [Solibacillus silvestris]|uniref:DUF2642 domain-containing protein n=1 Tax=Solibacillus silvestris TaxID=76853 RepID=UPI003F7F3F99
MGKLRVFLNSLKGSNIEVATEYSKVRGVLLEVNFDYITLRKNSDLLYIPLAGIQNVAY